MTTFRIDSKNMRENHTQTGIANQIFFWQVRDLQLWNSYYIHITFVNTITYLFFFSCIPKEKIFLVIIFTVFYSDISPTLKEESF